MKFLHQTGVSEILRVLVIFQLLFSIIVRVSIVVHPFVILFGMTTPQVSSIFNRGIPAPSSVVQILRQCPPQVFHWVAGSVERVEEI